MGFCGAKSSFHFLLRAHAIGILSGKENDPKEKGASNPAHFPLETRYPAPMACLPTGLKCAALSLDIPPVRHLNFQRLGSAGQDIGFSPYQAVRGPVSLCFPLFFLAILHRYLVYVNSCLELKCRKIHKLYSNFNPRALSPRVALSLPYILVVLHPR